MGYGPATGPTIKTALCHIRTLVGRMIKTEVMRFENKFCCDILVFVCISVYYLTLNINRHKTIVVLSVADWCVSVAQWLA